MCTNCVEATNTQTIIILKQKMTADARTIRESFLFKYCLSVTAACVAETVTYPLDLTKTRLQIQGEHDHKVIDGHGAHRGPKTQIPHRGMLATAFGIVREEGLQKLFQGISPALYRHVIYSGCRMSCYEMLRDKVFKKNADGSFSVWKASLAGLCAGAFGQFVASPTDLVKVRMQMEGRRQLEGKPPRVKNTRHALQQIFREAGLRGLWSGWVPNVQRAALVNLGDLATYDTVKHMLLKHTGLGDNYITHSVASLCSGFVASLVSTPADVMKTRVMNQPTKDGKGLLYSGSTDCFLKTVRQEGFLALYKGLLPCWIRLTPWFLVFWVTYEEVRKLMGTSSF